jgi:hypothetical protein
MSVGAVNTSMPGINRMEAIVTAQPDFAGHPGLQAQRAGAWESATGVWNAMEQKTGLRIGAGGKAPRRVAEFAAQRTYGFKLMGLRKPRFSHESEMKEIPAFRKSLAA